MSDWKQISAQEVEAAVADLRRQLAESGRGQALQRVDCSDEDPAQGQESWHGDWLLWNLVRVTDADSQQQIVMSII